MNVNNVDILPHLIGAVPPPVVSKLWKPYVPLFLDRLDAGHHLAKKLIGTYDHALLQNAVYLGCVRGGLVTALGVIEIMKEANFSCELDIVIPRKLRLPDNNEYGIGSLTEKGTAIFLPNLVIEHNIDINSLAMQEHIKAEQKELLRRQNKYRNGCLPPDLTNRTVVIVDDGMASGATITAAIKSVQESGYPVHIIVAVPVSSKKAEKSLMDQTGIPISDICICEYAQNPPGHIWSIDDFYTKFDDVEDETVISILSSRGNI